MERLAAELLLCIAVWGLTSAGVAAQAPEKVALFVVSGPGDGPPHVDDVLEQVRTELTSEGKGEVRPDLVPVSSERDVGLERARAVGRAAFNELAEGRPPAAVLATYGEPIVEALGDVSSVQDPEGRSLLWNLCALRVHLLMLGGGEGDELATRAAVLDCSRRFIDRSTFDKAWLEEVLRKFQQVTSEVRQVPLSVRSAPAGCEVRVYGAAVGVTPLVVELIPGSYELQIVCADREGALHRVQVASARDLTIRLDADAAFTTRSGTTWLRYEDGTASAQVLDDLVALAREAGADSFVVVRADRGAALEVQWRRPPGTLLGSSVVDTSADAKDRRRGIGPVFRAEARDAVDSRRTWADYTVGVGLLVAGASWSVYPMLAMARDGQCTDGECDTTYDGRSWKAPMSLAAAGAIAASGIAVLWMAPFGKRQVGVAVANGLVVRGTF